MQPGVLEWPSYNSRLDSIRVGIFSENQIDVVQTLLLTSKLIGRHAPHHRACPPLLLSTIWNLRWHLLVTDSNIRLLVAIAIQWENVLFALW